MKQNKWQKRAEWLNTRRILRTEVTRVMRDIERGMVNEIDLAKLNNFCMTALMLLSKIEEPTWRASEKDAELAAMLRDEVEEEEDGYQVVLAGENK